MCLCACTSALPPTARPTSAPVSSPVVSPVCFPGTASVLQQVPGAPGKGRRAKGCEKHQLEVQSPHEDGKDTRLIEMGVESCSMVTGELEENSSSRPGLTACF